MGTDELTHVNRRGQARMVDVSDKPATLREAVAAGRVSLSHEAWKAVRENRVGKGDVLAVVRLAAIQAAKRTADWIPLCHSVAMDEIAVEVDLDETSMTAEIRARCRARAVTGVEMEALVAVSAAALALYDMVKALDRGAIIGPIGVVRKTGGRSGEFQRQWPPGGPLGEKAEQ